jgi:hypothetical protein
MYIYVFYSVPQTNPLCFKFYVPKIISAVYTWSAWPLNLLVADRLTKIKP